MSESMCVLPGEKAFDIVVTSVSVIRLVSNLTSDASASIFMPRVSGIFGLIFSGIKTIYELQIKQKILLFFKCCEIII